MNDDLTLPPLGDRDAIVAFAASFNGYRFHGSSAACFAASEAKRRETIDDLRTKLFVAYRVGNNRADSSVVIAAFAELLPYFERMLAEGD